MRDGELLHPLNYALLTQTTLITACSSHWLHSDFLVYRLVLSAGADGCDASANA